ncbi:MAG: hypothetical protein LBG96_09725 [Tannerella sp.]|jgi:hypothetical protein|nr:hypothetical protein [Tannerella sp.]
MLLLTTDLSLSFNKAMEIYQIRWTIEVLFKECRQYLRPGKSQNTDFNPQIADTTLALATYTILSLEKRFNPTCQLYPLKKPRNSKNTGNYKILFCSYTDTYDFICWKKSSIVPE